MKKFKSYLVVLIMFLLTTLDTISYSPQNKDFGFGIMLGEPTGLTAKIWTARDRAFALSLGNSYLGKFRIGADYLFHFNAFNSNVVNMYAGPGAAIGIGQSGGWWYSNDNKNWYKQDSETGVGVRGVFGVNVVPRNTPLEIFGEIGVMIGIIPSMHTNAEGAIGIRFYF